MPEQTHAVLSPSGAAGWLVCAGKPAMEKGLPDDSNEYSDFGTAGHAVAAMCLTEKQDPAAYLGRRIDVGHHKTVEVDAEMVGAVRVYCNAVNDAIERYKLAGATSVELLVEQRVPIGHITGEEGAEGTADVVLIVLWSDGTALLEVRDLKLGKGIKVDAEENPQGMLYALGAIEKFSCVTEFNKVVIAIHQPRLSWEEKPSEWEVSVDVLKQFTWFARERASLALAAYETADVPPLRDDALLPLTPGEHCRKTFCKARATCPALAAYVTDSVGADFEVIAVTKAPDALVNGSTAAFIAAKFRAIDIIEDWCKAVRARAEALLFESNNSPDVIAELGIKLVQGKQGNRAWSAPEEVEKLLKESMRLSNKIRFDMKLISPTTAEKRLKPKQWSRIQEFVTRAPGQPSVVKADDKRPALVLTPVADDFEHVEDVSDLA